MSILPTHVYYDLDVMNANSNAGKREQMTFNETRDSPFLKSPENYYASVIRFYVETPSLPIFIPRCLIGQSDPNKLCYSVSMSYGGYTQQQYIQYVSQDTSQPTPSAPTTQQDLSTEYYYMYSFQDVMYMLNQSFVSCFINLNSQISLPVGSVAPFFEFDIPNQKFIFNSQIDVFSSDGNSSKVQVYFNNALQTLLCSFRYKKTNLSLGRDYQIQIYNNNSLNSINVNNQYVALQQYQEVSTIDLMNPISSIVFTSGLLPISQSLLANPVVYNGTDKIINNNNNTLSILADFQLPFDNVSTYRPSISYVNTGEYKMVDLYGNSPINTIQISCFWKDYYGNLKPFYLNTGCGAYLKLLFRRKE